MPQRLLVADQHELIHVGLQRLVGLSGIELVGCARTGEEAIERTLHHMPDVLVSDTMFPDMHGVDAMATIRERLPSLPIVVLAASDSPTYAARMSLLGISDYVLKSSSLENILDAILRALSNSTPPANSLLVQVRNLLAKKRPEHIEDFPLTQREFQVLRHVAVGLSNREIGRSLKISIETVKEHVQNILRKIDANDRTQAAVQAVKCGLVSLETSDD